MKRLLLTGFVLAAIGQPSAQIIYKVDGETIRYTQDKLVTMTHLADTLYFTTTAGSTQNFVIDDIDKIAFAIDPSAVQALPADGKTHILYHSQSQIIEILHATEENQILVYDIQGKMLKQRKGIRMQVSDLNAGLYIVHYGNLNAKILIR